MEPALLNSVICGTCRTPLLQRFENNGVLIYKCKCLLKVRAILACKNCKKQFLNLPYLIRKTNYCSLGCYWIGTNRKQLRICKSCNKEFYADATLIRKGYGFYCTRDCWFSIFKKWKKPVKCKQCKKEFLVIRAVYKKHPKFCNKKCSDNSKIDHIFRTCRECKRNFKLTNSAINRGRGSFCTWECYKKFKGETRIERLVRLELQKLKEPFKQEVRLGSFRADFYLPKRNMIIECDGKYWHASGVIKERDERKDKFLRQQGYILVRLSEDDIRNDVQGSLNALLTNLYA